MTTSPIVCGGHVVLGYQTCTGFGSFTPVSGTRVNVGSTCRLTAPGWRILVGGFLRANLSLHLPFFCKHP